MDIDEEKQEHYVSFIVAMPHSRTCKQQLWRHMLFCTSISRGGTARKKCLKRFLYVDLHNTPRLLNVKQSYKHWTKKDWNATWGRKEKQEHYVSFIVAMPHSRTCKQQLWRRMLFFVHQYLRGGTVRKKCLKRFLYVALHNTPRLLNVKRSYKHWTKKHWNATWGRKFEAMSTRSPHSFRATQKAHFLNTNKTLKRYTKTLLKAP